MNIGEIIFSGTLVVIMLLLFYSMYTYSRDMKQIKNLKERDIQNNTKEDWMKYLKLGGKIPYEKHKIGRMISYNELVYEYDELKLYEYKVYEDFDYISPKPDDVKILNLEELEDEMIHIINYYD